VFEIASEAKQTDAMLNPNASKDTANKKPDTNLLNQNPKTDTPKKDSPPKAKP
jgi:hypothetical protein